MRAHRIVLAAAGALSVLAAVAPARADWDHDGWRRREWREHERREHEWREHEWRRHERHQPGYVYAPPPPVIYRPPAYSAPPAVYAPPPGVRWGNSYR
jgi:hypothetical protein